MINNSGPSIYVPTDKNIYDALKHKKITVSELIIFLRGRGVFVSNNIDKDKLIEKISSLTFGYKDFQWICSVLENPNRKVNTTHKELKGNVKDAQIKAACEVVKSNLVVLSDDSVKITKSGNTTTMTVTYLDQDFTKTELRQRVIKTCEIKLENSDDGVAIKLPSSKKAKDVTEQIQRALSVQVKTSDGEDLKEHSISLESVANAKLRSGFFDLLTKNIEDFEFETVTNVDIYHFDQEKGDEFESNEEGDEARLASYINKAALNGAGVLESKEFQQLHKQGFFIYRIIWTAFDLSREGPKVEFEAKFGNPSLCTDFMYTVRSIYQWNPRTSGYNVTRRAALPYENDKYNSKLREASEKVLKEIMKEYKE
jgi:hypothetical protein